jgi:PKHD-type hydroxylase
MWLLQEQLFSDPIELVAHCNKAFTNEECDEFIKVALEQSINPEQGNVPPEYAHVGEGALDTGIRVSKTKFIAPTEKTEMFYRKLVDLVTHANEKYFKFELTGFYEWLQYTEYYGSNTVENQKGLSGFYGKHVDRKQNKTARKLSVVIQLTDPAEYEGGELILYFGEEPTKIPKEKGFAAFFPSWVVHEVTPVTKGERRTLVLWVTGPAFR